jgi:hypothetical protein
MGQADLLSLLSLPPYRRQRAQVADIVPVGLLFNGLGGTNGALPTSSDTGVGNAWDVVSQGSGAVLQYDNSQGASQGCQSLQMSTGATAVSNYVRWTASLGIIGSHPMMWFTTYMFLTANPPTTFSVVSPRRDNDAGSAGSFRVSPSGNLLLLDSSNATQKTSVTTLPLNQPFRLECRVVSSDGVGGLLEARLFYTPDSSVPDEVLAVGGIATTGGGVNVSGCRFGVGANTVANVPTFNLWGMQASNVGYPNPLANVGQTITLTDSGSGSDSLSVAASLNLADSGLASDTVGDSVSMTLADAGTSVDTIVSAITAALTDSGTGSDSLSATQPKTLTDSGSGVESIAVSVVAMLNDFGEGVDSVVQYFHFGDTGQGSDTAVIAVTVTLSDSGSGTDAIQASPVLIVNLSDSGTGSDTLVAVPDNTNTITLTDSGTGADTFSVSPLISLSDSGSGLDSVQVSVQMWLGFDDPVPEGHEPFDPAIEEPPDGIQITFQIPEPYAERTGMTVAPLTWKMEPELFLAHMSHMHGGKDPRQHMADHIDGEGGVVRHIHR